MSDLLLFRVLRMKMTVDDYARNPAAISQLLFAAQEAADRLEELTKFTVAVKALANDVDIDTEDASVMLERPKRVWPTHEERKEGCDQLIEEIRRENDLDRANVPED